MNNIYLDHAATSPLSQSMKEYLYTILNDYYGNPSSIHSVGLKSKNLIDEVRKKVAKFINARPENIYLTSSGSASNTLAIKGYYSKHNCCVLHSPTAHKSIIECVKNYKYSYPLKVDGNGFIDIDDLKEWLDTKDIKPFVVIEYANSEIGTIQDVKKIIDLVHFYNGLVFVDCTGSISTIPLDVKQLNPDMAAFSAHKLGGLKGCGVLYKRNNIELKPLIYGSQEKSLVGGTENILGIAALGFAIDNKDYKHVSEFNRNYVYGRLVSEIDNCYMVGAFENRLANNLYMCFKGIEGESLMLLLDMNGIQVSTGSACNSNSLEAHSTLKAIGMNPNDMHSCIRISFSGKESIEELDYACNTINDCVKRLRSFKSGSK